MLKKEFDYYLKHQDELVKKYNGKYLVIVGEEIVGTYDTIEEAYVEARRKYEPGTFLIHECTPGDAAYTWVFHSPCVSFPSLKDDDREPIAVRLSNSTTPMPVIE